MSNTTVPYVLSIQNPAFCSYLICVCLLILKMMVLTVLTVLHRMQFKTFLNPEDAKWNNGSTEPNETVERVRRAYQNDLEGIPLFFMAALGYLFINPPLWIVNILFTMFFVVRVLHSIVYAIYVIQQPARAAVWLVGFFLTAYMAIDCAIFVFTEGYAN